MPYGIGQTPKGSDDEIYYWFIGIWTPEKHSQYKRKIKDCAKNRNRHTANQFNERFTSYWT